MNFDELCGSVKHATRCVAKKVSETADIATLQIKLSSAQGKLEDAYTLLGRAAYLHFTSEEDHSERVAIAVTNVGAAKAMVDEIKAQIAEARAKSAQKKEK